MKKKVVWLPYDMDTGLGINNEGELVFDYRLEDIDKQQSGADVYNGQQSVIWKNIRAAFPNELAAMYQSLRSSGALSYAKVEQMFEEHQGKWPETVFNEDSYFKYIEPLLKDNVNYLGMLLGSKAEQRKWWLYNRFRYIDSKYVAGDALTDYIMIRPYAAQGLSITPYADIYTTVKWDDQTVQKRTQRGTTAVIPCPYQTMNDNVVWIYSASQLASIGDISGLQVGLCDISMATRLQSLKIGDASASYENANLRSLTLGNNVLLKTIDARNCSGLGDTTIQGHTQTHVNLSGCSILENVYFGGTKINGLTLPNGGVIKVLSLPKTLTSLIVLNQSKITTFEIEDSDYSNISTLRIENCSSAIPVLDILAEIPAKSRVRIIGMNMTVSSTSEVEEFYDYLDTMAGLDENGDNLPNAVVSGTITGLGTITGAWLAQMYARYPDIRITYEHITSKLYYYNGSTLYYTESITDGANGVYTGTPTKTQDAQYTYTFAGWSREDDNTVDADARTAVIADRSVYACYTSTVRTYTVTWKNGTTMLATETYDYGETPTYKGTTPTQDGKAAIGWDPEISTVTGNITYTALYTPKYNVYFYNGSTLLYTATVEQGSNASYSGTTPTNPEGTTFLGWSRTQGAGSADSTALNNIQANTNVYAVFESPVEVVEITDDWATIVSKINAGTADYGVGNYKPLDLGTEGIVNMQIVGKNASELASGGGTAMYDWLSMELLTTSKRMNPSSVTNYKFEEDESFVRGSTSVGSSNYNQWNAQNSYTANNTAKITIVATAVTDGTLRLSYVPGAQATHTTSLKINGTDVVSSYGTSAQNYDLAITNGETYTIVYETTKLNASVSTNTYVKLCDTSGSGTNANVSALVTQDSVTIENCTVRKFDSYQSGTGAVGGWIACEMRTYLKETIKPLIPETVRNAIKPVTKYTRNIDTAGSAVNNVVSTEDVWLPSMREMGFNGYETSGPKYSAIFKDNASRVKKKVGAASASFWWCRSADGNGYFSGVGGSGNYSSGAAGGSYPLPLGFSL